MPKKKTKRKSKSVKTLIEFLTRLFAVFIAYSFQAIAAGALIGVEVEKAILMAGIMGVATTFQYMARAYIDDGKMTSIEFNEAFQKTTEKLDEK